MMRLRLALLFLAASAGSTLTVIADEPPSYQQRVAATRPVLYWNMSQSPADQAVGEWGGPPTLEAGAKWPVTGASPDRHPVFADPQQALQLPGNGARLVVDDPGAESPLDFDLGDAITIEAWVKLDAAGDGRHSYVVGKGRTNRAGQPKDNQNYALRLTGKGGRAFPSFLFRSRGPQPQYHRWTADRGMRVGEWHHVAVSYRFGEPDSLRGFLDGGELKGVWDMGGKTTAAPVVDDDQLWIGSSMGGSSGSSFVGAIDELAIHRALVAPEELQARFAKTQKIVDWGAKFAGLPAGQVLVEVYANAPEELVELDDEIGDAPRAAYVQHEFAATAIPNEYLAGGVPADLSTQLVRMYGVLKLDSARHWELLLRSKNGSRLWIDGELAVETPLMSRNSSGHESVPELARVEGQLAALSAGHQEQRQTVELAAGEHRVIWDLVVGGKGVRVELGEAYLGARAAGSDDVFALLGPAGTTSPLTEAFRTELVERLREATAALNTRLRREASAKDDHYWRERHALAAEIAAELRPDTPAPVAGYPANNAIDHFLNARLAQAGIRPAELTDPDAFLRRVTLDVSGVIPTAEEWAAFHAESADQRRSRTISRLLATDRWADHWVSYWQDVLAENPGILKPKLNNTGPFRFWIHEAMVDNKPFDRFATELIRMRGSVYDGGPGGFSLATQNDVPMAAKAHVIANAFLGVEMKCARCHDAPYHPYQQKELMGLAAFLERKAIKLPVSSTVPENPGGRKPLVKSSLEPGAVIDPQWPFDQWVTLEQATQTLPADADQREQLAGLVTSPYNVRFAEVVVNRMWHRYFGRGLNGAIDDWHDSSPLHPELLRFLACELMSHQYDLKHVASLMLNSHAYQRQLAPGRDSAELDLFAAPSRRRMSAEQLLDSLLSAAGKAMDTEPLSLDPEGRRDSKTFLNLGEPRRAWEFTSLANERDRPALALPAAQTMVDLLAAYGWRESRPNPIAAREEEPTMLQPLTLANGLAGMRATRLSDDHVVTEMALDDVRLEELIDRLFAQFLTRAPTAAERANFAELLQPGFDSRVIPGAPKRPRERLRNPVSWSNHLNHEATRIKQELERRVRQGDPPTQRLASDWRERLEDGIWALLNSPEFVFVP
ncbi:MAG: DUF1553 domain-containing protein [Planctomycetales bacterium]|nr:DUF1553 domain-containing protein [Planctomycetales bacterium]